MRKANKKLPATGATPVATKTTGSTCDVASDTS